MKGRHNWWKKLLKGKNGSILLSPIVTDSNEWLYITNRSSWNWRVFFGHAEAEHGAESSQISVQHEGLIRTLEGPAGWLASLVTGITAGLGGFIWLSEELEVQAISVMDS